MTISQIKFVIEFTTKNTHVRCPVIEQYHQGFYPVQQRLRSIALKEIDNETMIMIIESMFSRRAE